MAELSHTQGEWEADSIGDVDNFSSTTQVIVADIVIRRPNLPPVLLATVYAEDTADLRDKAGSPGYATAEQAAANAQLLAAAPALLRELIDFHSHAIDQGFHDCESFSGECPVQQAIDKAIGDHGSNNKDEHEHGGEG